MQFEIAFGGPAADLEVTLSGIPKLAAFEALNAQLIADPRFRAGLTTLVDVSGIDSSGLSDDEMQLVGQLMVERDFDYAPAAVALIAPDEGTFNDLRLFRAHLGGKASKRHIVRTRAEAVAWLDARN